MHRRLLAICASTILLSACASFDAMQKPDDSLAKPLTADTYGIEQYLVQMHGKDDAARTLDRNRFIWAHVGVIDHNYDDFKRHLSHDMKGGNFGLDLGLLAVTGTAAVWTSLAAELAAGATAIAGAKASFNRELYSERTFSVLVSLMDAQRLEVLAQLMRGSQLPESQYPIEQAYADLSRYQAAGNLDSAVQAAAEAAANKKAAADYNFSQALNVCEAPAEIADARRAYLSELGQGRNDPAGLARIAKAAQIAGMTDTKAAATPDALNLQAEAISAYLTLKVCTTEGLAAFKTLVDSSSGAPSASPGDGG